MPRPGDWNAIGLGGDPTPGEPETIGQLAEVLQKLGGKAREIFNAIETVMNTNNDSVFVGATADALRGKVDGRLRGHVEDVANAFETSATALREWRGVVEDKQRTADAALSAGRGLAEDDPERERQKGIAEQAGRDQSEQASTYAGRINGVSDIQLPISECEAFWEAFKWLAIILIIPALIFGGPIALLALGVNLALFIKTIVDVANGDATFLDLFLAGLGLIAPTTKALPIFSILKGIAKGIGAGVKGLVNTFKTVFSKDFLINGLLAGLKAMPMLATIAIRETGLFVVQNIRNFSLAAGNFVNNFGKISLGALTSFKTGITTFRPGSIVTGFKSAWTGFTKSPVGQFLSAHLGGLQWTRIFLPVAADEIRAFRALGMTNFEAFAKALKVGVFGRGVFAQNVFGLPTVSAIGRGIGAIPIDTGATASIGKSFLQQLTAPEVRIPSVHINNLGMATGSGFNAGKAFTAIDEIHLAPMNDLGTQNLGISVHTPTTVTTGGVHVPTTAGTPSIVGNAITGIPSPHVGQPSLNGMTGTVHVSQPATSIGSLHVAAPQSTNISDLVGTGLRNNAPAVSPHFASSIGEGVSHGFQANHIRLSIDEIVNLPAGSTHGSVHSVAAPTVDRVNAALDLLHGPAPTVHVQPVNVQPVTVQPVTVTRADVPIQPTTVHSNGHSFSTGPGRTEIPLTGLPDHPGAVVKIERLDGGMTTFNLHGGGPNGRLDPLNGGAVRFTDTSTGTTTRFDSNGVAIDHGVRLTKADGLPRIDDRVLIKQPGGDFRITSLDGNVVPEQLAVRPLDTGGVQVLGKDGTQWHYNAQGKLESHSATASWNSDLAAKAGVFHKPAEPTRTVPVKPEPSWSWTKAQVFKADGVSDTVAFQRMDDWAQVEKAQLELDAVKREFGSDVGRVDGPSTGPSAGEFASHEIHLAQQQLDDVKAAFEVKHGLNADQTAESIGQLRAIDLSYHPGLLGGSGRPGRGLDLPGADGMQIVRQGQNLQLSEASDLFRMQPPANGTVVVERLGAPGGDVVHTWTVRPGFRPSVVGETFTLSDGPLAGHFVDLRGAAGQLDGVLDQAGTSWPMRATGDDLIISGPGGPLHYDRSGNFQGLASTATRDLGAPVPPPHLTGDGLTRWNAQVDLSRTHLTAAAQDKKVELLMKDVKDASFTSKRGYGGFVKPSALSDGTLATKVETFNQVTKDLLLKGPDDSVTLYRGVSMDPISAQADEFIERLPSSTSNNFAFQQEWAHNGAASNRFVFEIDVPPGHGKLAMSYPDGYHPGAGEARAWNQSQWEVTLAPTVLRRTGPDRIQDGLTIIPVRAEQIPPGRIGETLSEAWPGLPINTAYDDFVDAFGPGSVNRWDGFENVTVTSAKSADGNLTTLTVTKPGYADQLNIQVSKDLDAGTVGVKIDGGASEFSKGPWKSTELGDLAAQLRGKVLNDSDLFLHLPQPPSWAREPVVVNTVHVPVVQQHPLTGAFGQHTVMRPQGGQTHVVGPNAGQFRVQDLTDGGFRVTGPNGQMQRYGADGAHLGDGRALTGQFHVRGTVFTESDGAGGIRLVDLQGTPIPNTRAELLTNGQIRISEDQIGVTWYGRNGVQTGTGVHLTDPAYQGQHVFVYRQHGMDPVLIDNAGTRLPGTVTASDGGIRITEANGIARTFDARGNYLDRRIPLVDPAQPGAQRLVVHDVNNNLTLHDPAGGPAVVQHIPGGGYRVIDQGNYRAFDADGGFQAHGYAVNLPGETGFLHVTATGAQRLDGTFQPIPGRNANIVAGEIVVTRPGGHDVFDLQGHVLREVTDLDGHALGLGGGRVTRDQNGAVTWTAANGTPIPPHHVTMDANGLVRLELNLPGSPRNGEFHAFSRDGHLTQQGFPVVRGNRPTGFTYVVNRTDNTWSRVDGTGTVGTGAFHHGRVDLSGAENGRIKLLSSTGKPVEVFERRWLPDGSILDSFRKTDTLGFGRFDRSTGWATYDQAGAMSGWGSRHFDTAGSGWRDVDRSYHTIREYRDGLQKYHTGTGHVLGTKQADGSWQWHRYDDHASVIAQGNRTLERIGDGWTDTFTRTVGGRAETVVAQQKWGSWHLPETAGQYREYTMTRGANNSVTRADTWLQHARQGKDSGSAVNVGTELLTVIRQGEQRPPVWIRDGRLFDNPRPGGSAAHFADDGRFQVYSWSKGNQHGTRYVGMDGAATDIDAHGNFVRSSGTLGDGTKIKVGDHAGQPPIAHPSGGGLPWEAGANRGWRLNTAQGWEDVQHVNGNWVVVRESQPGGVVREYNDPAVRTVWSQRDAHGNLTGLSHQGPDRPGIFIEGTGAADSARWTWREVDVNGTAIGGRGGERQFFRGSTDDSLSWDDSFRDFDAAGNLVRDRRMLDGGRYVESWWTANGWRSGQFDKFGNQVAGTVPLERVWSTGEGGWQADWSRGAVYSRDQLPGVNGAGAQVVRETPLHVDGGPIRIREYHLDNGITDLRRWKEFDHGSVVRDRQPSGNNYLETDAWRGQWKLYDRNGNLLGERSDNGLVFELRDGRLHLTGNEYDFRGPLTELRGWGRRVREAQRMPWLNNTEWTVHGTTITPPGGAAFREARYTPYWKVVAQKAMLEFAQDFVLEFAANLIVNAIVSAAQNKPFTGKDALKSLMNAAVSSTIKTGVGTALTETKLGGSLRNLKLGLTNVDSGKHWNRRPLNHDKNWSNEWGGNEGPTRWRGGTFDFAFNLGPTVLSGFVNGTMNAAIFGVSNADGTTVKLTGWDAVGDGGINAVSSLTSGVSTALVKNLATGIGGTRFFHRQGFADFWLQLPFRVFEKSIQSVFLTSAYRASINPSWYQSPTSPLVLPGNVTVPSAQPQPVTTTSGLWVPPGPGGAS